MNVSATAPKRDVAPLPTVTRVLVIGAGTMGSGIAQIVAEACIQTMICDADPRSLEHGIAGIRKRWQRAVEKGTRSPEDLANFGAHIEPGRIEDASAADLIIEAIAERLDAKSALFADLAGVARPETIFASNTSSLSITALGKASGRPHNLVGLHFFNPVPVLPLVEVVAGLETAPGTIKAAVAFAERIGKIPVVVHDSPGFVANRVLLPMINEAIFTLEQGVASAESIDRVMKLGMAHPMGPLALADLIGLDICLEILETLHGDFGDDKYRPAPLLRRMVAAGRLGRKTSHGFFAY